MIQEDLKHLVSRSVKTLGLAVKEVHGTALFNQIESVRKEMKKVRGAKADLVEKALEQTYKKLKSKKDAELRLIAKAFSLMLELINSCEAAYRSHRLGNFRIKSEYKKNNIIYVFTSHPTEARSQGFLKLMSEVQELLQEALESDFSLVEERLRHLMRIAVRLDLANNSRPQVKDEMEQVFQIVLSPEILAEQIALNQKDIALNFRTWVGGDKDGHPKVGAKTMLQSFQLSRTQLLTFAELRLKSFEEELFLIPEGKSLLIKTQAFRKTLISLKKVQDNDGKKITTLKRVFVSLLKAAEKLFLDAPELKELKTLLWLYPALVLPLEIREDSSLIKAAVSDRKQPIVLMLKTLAQVSRGFDPKWYVRGFIISMCMSTEDYLAAVKITIRELRELRIPIIPLFENAQGLKNARAILTGAMKAHPLQKIHRQNWGKRFEVMVGYSDSSKENGVLPSRIMVEEALFDLEDFLKKKGLTPVFFHGSGGSTSRGGGSVQEQISWWPQSALDIFKVTIQGEMVQRNFNHHLIMRSQVGKVLESYTGITPRKPKRNDAVLALVDSIQREYRSLVTDPSFHDLTMQATPYQYLDLLRIGSRPTKRSEPGKFSLRAIPWILCWTQTRLVLPVWWGLGSGWKAMTPLQKKSISDYYQSSALMQSYVKNLGFTLAKVELGVWNFHLENSQLPKKEKNEWREKIETELQLVVKFFEEISGEKNYTWFRPWLSESIYFRSSMIHPLNVIQKLALERQDHVLLRETVTGIASGMLTTG